LILFSVLINIIVSLKLASDFDRWG